MLENIIVKLVDDNGKIVDYDILGIMNDYCKTHRCPRIATTNILPFSVENYPDPLWEPPLNVKEINPFRKYPCKQCVQHRRRGKFDEKKGSRYVFNCETYKGKVIEVGFFQNHLNGTSQQNLSSIPLE